MTSSSIFCFLMRLYLNNRKDSVGNLSRMKVLISGINATGVEIGFSFVYCCELVLNVTAKNLILTGVGRVTLHDDKQVQFEDIGGNVRSFPLLSSFMVIHMN